MHITRNIITKISIYRNRPVAWQIASTAYRSVETDLGSSASADNFWLWIHQVTSVAALPAQSSTAFGSTGCRSAKMWPWYLTAVAEGNGTKSASHVKIGDSFSR